MTREEAIAELKMFKGHTFNKTEEAIDMAIEAFNQQKEGHWIEDEIAAYNGEYGAGYFCSVCGGYGHNEKYCSHCGAKMKKWVNK